MEPAIVLPNWRFVARIICLSFGALFAGGAALWMIGAFLSGPSWATTRGEVFMATTDRRESTIHQSSRQGGSYQNIRYTAEIGYHYRVGGRDYTGFGIGDGTDWTYASQSEAMAAMAPYRGAGVTVYYDPADPERSALDPNALSSVPLFFGGIGLLLLGMGYGLYRAEKAAAAAEPVEDYPAEV